MTELTESVESVESAELPELTEPSAGTDPLAPYDAVLILSYGGPEGPDDVLPFMRNATAGRGIPDSRLLEVSGHYSRFGGVSPINARNAEMLTALRAELAARGSRVPVVIGNRNWHPFVSEAMRSLADAGARRILTMTTSAYGSYSGCRQYREDTAAALAQLAAGTDGSTGEGFEADAAARVGGAGGGPVELTVDKTRPFYNTPGMLAANADAIADAFAALAARGVDAAGVRLVLVTHSIPQAMERGSAPSLTDAAQMPDLEPGMAADLSTEISYVEQHRRLIDVLLPEVAARLTERGLLDGAITWRAGTNVDGCASQPTGLASEPAAASDGVGTPAAASQDAAPATLDYDLVYCSRSGPPQARWLEPDVNDHLEALADAHLTDGTPTTRPAGVVVAPIGFVADHMEVVFDLDTEAKETAARLGLPYERAATAGTHPAFIASLADVLLERAAVARGEDVTPASTTGTGPFHTVCPPGCCRQSDGAGRPGHPSRRPHSDHSTDHRH